MDGTNGTYQHTHFVPQPAPPPQRGAFGERTEMQSLLRGEDAPLEHRGPFALIEALLKRPLNVMHEVRETYSMSMKLGALVLVSMALVGVIVATSAGGAQLFIVPLKVSVGMFACALICLPSLYIFTALSGSEASLKETFGALMLGVAITGVLMVAFAPVSWVFTQATDSTQFLGGLHLTFLFISAMLGMRVTRRALAARTGHSVPANMIWTIMFVLVVVQMTTTLRPLVGPWDGTLFAPRQFFLVHWFT
jgi:hypothetical protein